MKKTASYTGILFGIIILYLIAWPIPINPKKVIIPEWPGMVGAFAKNNFLDIIKIEFEGKCNKCEDVAADSLGIYGGSVDGDIIYMSHDYKNSEIISNTGGRPLGLDFDHSGNLIIADLNKGLLSMDKNGSINLLTNEYNGKPYGLIDDVIVSHDSIIYFSDATIHGEFKLDVLEHGRNGRLYSYNLNTKIVSLLLDSLYFPNSIAISENDSFLLITETTDYKILKYWLKGKKKGKSEVFIDNLPGFPDGIWHGQNGIYWVAFPAIRQPKIDKLMPKPFIRKIIARLPGFLKPDAQPYSLILGFDENAKVIYNLQDPQGRFNRITNIYEYEGKLYLGSLSENGIGILSIEELPYFD